MLNGGTNAATPTGSRLAEIWSEVLKHDQFGLDDNFFAIGGHSMFATLVTYRMRDEWGLEFPLTLIFEHSTVRELATAVDEARASASGGAETSG